MTRTTRRVRKTDMNTLFFDTETTGLTYKNKPDTHPKQPMAVQLGIKIDEANRKERGALNYLIKTEGWEVSQGAYEATGINNEIADSFGVGLITACEMFFDMIDVADVVVAHNAAYDIVVMRRMTQVWSEYTGEAYFDPFEGKTLICTMMASIDIVKAEPKRKGQWKWPRLEECVKFFFNEELEGAHDALVDVRACARVYYELLDMGVFSGDYKFT